MLRILMIFLCIIQVSAIEKPVVDARLYEPLVLENGLRVLLVSDPEAKEAAASLTVGVGHLQNPEKHDGMAHFLEHMLFLGTKKYPDPQGFFKYLKERGGSSNAWTSDQFTSYYFSVLPSGFSGALDRFSQFFIAPLLQPKYVDKERHAVDSEWQMRQQSDMVRLFAVNRLTANPESPYSRFDVGSLKSLAGDESALADAVRNFYSTYYHANRMTLVVVAPLPIATLKDMVKRDFSAISATKAPIKALPPVFTEKQLGVDIHVQSLKQDRSINVLFPVANQYQFYPDKSYAYLTYMFSRTDHGSLFEKIRPLGVVDLSAGFIDDSAEYGSFFIGCDVTEQGLKNKDKITKAILDYVGYLQNFEDQKQVFSLLQGMGQRAFDTSEKMSPTITASHLSVTLQRVSADNALKYYYLTQDTPYQPEKIQALLARFNVKNMRRLTMAPDVIKDPVIEPYYQVPFTEQPFDESFIQAMTTKADLSGFTAPEKNPYVVLDPVSKVNEHTEVPQLLEAASDFEFWVKKENKVPTMRSVLDVFFYPAQPQSASHQAHMALWSAIANDKMQVLASKFGVAGVWAGISTSDMGLRLHVTTFKKQMPVAITEIMKQLDVVAVDQEQFEKMKQHLLDDLRGFKESGPLTRGMHELYVKLDKSIANEELIAAVTRTSLAQFRANAKKMSFRVGGLLVGNYTDQEVRLLKDRIRNGLVPFRLSKQSFVGWPQIRASERLHIPQYAHDNAMINAYFVQLSASDQHGKDKTALADEKIATAMMLNQLLSNRFFHELRTEKQLGYVVQTTVVAGLEQALFAFLVQSPHASAVELEGHLQTFLKGSNEWIEKLELQTFISQRDALIEQLEQPPETIAEVSSIYFRKIMTQSNDFERKERVIKCLKQMSLQQLRSSFQQTLLGDGLKSIVITTKK